MTINATGPGWCDHVDGCNNTNTNTLKITLAGNNPNSPGYRVLSIHRDCFTFTLPNLGADITSATVSIWDDRHNFNTVNPSAIFNLYEASSISYAGLTNGPSLGQISVDIANTGVDHFVTIDMNLNGLLALNAAQGSQFILGGNNDNGEQIFGYTLGTPAAFLTVTVVPVPPAFWLFSSGLLGLISYARKKAT